MCIDKGKTEGEITPSMDDLVESDLRLWWLDSSIPESVIKFVNDLIPDYERTKVNIITNSANVYRIKMYTDNYEYTITIHLDANYMGGFVRCRKERPGEDWHRGADLPDGKINNSTFYKILKSIIRHELQVIPLLEEGRKQHEMKDLTK